MRYVMNSHKSTIYPSLLNVCVVFSCASVPSLDLDAGKVLPTAPRSYTAGASGPCPEMNAPSSVAIMTPISAAVAAVTIATAEDGDGSKHSSQVTSSSSSEPLLPVA
jgi:hypothetical protein